MIEWINGMCCCVLYCFGILNNPLLCFQASYGSAYSSETIEKPEMNRLRFSLNESTRSVIFCMLQVACTNQRLRLDANIGNVAILNFFAASIYLHIA